MHLRSFILAAGLAAFLVSAARAELIASDSFITGSGGYTTNAQLAGQSNTNGTTGFSGAWTGNTSLVQASSGGLISGNPWEAGGRATLFTAFNNTGVGGRQITRALTNPAPTSLWFGGLFRIPTDIANDMFSRVGLTTFSNATSTSQPTSASSGFYLGLTGGTSDDPTDRVQLLTRNTSAVLTTYETGLSFNPGPTAVNSFLVHLEAQTGADGSFHATQDRLTVWLNPGDLTNLPGGFTLQTDALNTSTQLTRMILWTAFYDNDLGSTPAEPTIWDELRIGTTQFDVVPEPASLSLLVLATLPLHRRRRTRSA